MTIRKKLLLIAVLLLSIILTMTGIAYYQGRDLVSDMVNTTGTEILQSSVQNIDRLFEELFTIVGLASSTIRHAWIHESVSDEKKLESILEALTTKSKSAGIIDIYFAAEETGNFSDGGGWEEPDDYDPRTKDWYQKAVAQKNDGIALSEPYEDAEHKVSVITAATAIRDDNGKLIGVLGGDIDLSACRKSSRTSKSSVWAADFCFFRTA